MSLFQNNVKGLERVIPKEVMGQLLSVEITKIYRVRREELYTAAK